MFNKGSPWAKYGQYYDWHGMYTHMTSSLDNAIAFTEQHFLG